MADLVRAPPFIQVKGQGLMIMDNSALTKRCRCSPEEVYGEFAKGAESCDKLSPMARKAQKLCAVI